MATVRAGAISALILAAAATHADAQIYRDPRNLPPVQPAYPAFRTTGVPTGNFALPTVPLRALPKPEEPVFKATSLPLDQTVRDEAESATEPARSDPTAPGRVITRSAPPASQNAPAAASMAISPSASSQSSKVRYTAGLIISGKAKAYDGHSLVVDGHAIRLDGADAPGLLQICRTTAGVAWRCGEDAYRRLASLVDGKTVSCRVEQQVGEGAAAVCSMPGIKDVADLMVREGLAVPNGHDRGRYAGSADSARQARIGLWVGPFEAPWTWRARQRR
mgnify:FL=1|jgi:Micrococcal nuclease (thermonuclease) homologs